MRVFLVLTAMAAVALGVIAYRAQVSSLDEFLAFVGLGPEPKKPGESFRDCSDCPEMVVVPAGSFMMGLTAADLEVPNPRTSSDEGKLPPTHRVTLAKPFAVGKFEVTFAEWDACVAARGCKVRPDDYSWMRGRVPLVNVSWDDAQTYIAWLSAKTGKKYRLLSESEWEYAARAGSTTPYPWGNEILYEEEQVARCNGCNGDYREETFPYRDGPVPAGSYKPNKFGLFDMHGNACEWVADCHNETYAGAPVDGSAWMTGDCSLRMLRGGSWYHTTYDLRSADRFRNFQGTPELWSGFRLARDL